MSNSIQDKFIKNTLYIVIGILALTFIAIQPYNLFCRIKKTCQPITFSSFNIPQKEGKREITFKFVAKIPKELQKKIEFSPTEQTVTILNGKNLINPYLVKNLTKKDIVVGARFYIAPEGMEKYLERVECICFQNQPVYANGAASMGLNFRVDPKIEQDPGFRNVKEVTISYEAYLVN